VKAGTYVCVHDAPDFNGDIFPWVGEISRVVAPAIGDDIQFYLVKQIGRMQRTSFSFAAAQLLATVMTFEGPMCPMCKRPY